jgi:hypothetical protein
MAKASNLLTDLTLRHLVAKPIDAILEREPTLLDWDLDPKVRNPKLLSWQPRNMQVDSWSATSL